MSDELKFGLDDLEVADDLDVSLDNETYQDQVNPAPPVAGNYGVRALSLDYKKFGKGHDKEGLPVLVDGKFPVLVIGMAEIVEGLGDGVTRKVGLFTELGTKPFDRFGSSASGMNDLARSYGLPNYTGIADGISLLKEAFEANSVFAIGTDWTVYDSDFVEAAFEQLELDRNVKWDERDEDEAKLVNVIYRAARTTGMRNFPYDAARGRFSHVLQLGDVTFENPITKANVTITVPHRAIEARIKVTSFIPKQAIETGRKKLGPINVKVPKAVAA